ncbi:MAG: hypothetical protein AB7O37_20880 [Vicinamibacteria bacterium]
MGRATGNQILIHAASRTQWSLLGRLAQRLAGAGERLSLSHEGPDPRDTGPALAGGEATDFDGLAAAIPENDATPWFERLVPRPLKTAVLGQPRYRSFLALHRTRLEAARRLVHRTAPKLLIVAEDGVAGNPWLIKAAQDADVPVLVTPYGYGSRRDFDNALAQKYRAGDLILATGADGAKVLARYAQWVKATDFGPALLFPSDYVLARERLGLTLRDPWTVHGGPAERIAVESAMMRRHYLREGIPEGKLTVTGTVYCDVAYDALGAQPRYRRAFDDASKVELGQTRILVALPPSYHGERQAETEFGSYRELCEQTLGFLSALPGARLTVSIHPATLPEDRAAIERSGATISDAYVIELIARHDVFVTCFSSTIRWAIACRKPVANYDMYRFRLEDYAGVPGVLTVETQDDFRAVMRTLAGDEDHYRVVAGQLAQVSQDWGVIDGRNFDRIHALVKQLTERAG